MFQSMSVTTRPQTYEHRQPRLGEGEVASEQREGNPPRWIQNLASFDFQAVFLPVAWAACTRPSVWGADTGSAETGLVIKGNRR